MFGRLIIVASLLLVVGSVLGQDDSKIPLPEYYGIYLIIDGKACGLIVDTGCKYNKTTIETDQKGGVIVLNTALRLIVHQENPTAAVQRMELRPMIFLRNVTTNIMSTSSRTEAANSWRYLNPSESMLNMNVGNFNDKVQPLPFLVKPFKPGAVIIVPSQALGDGVYRLTWAETNMEYSLMFYVGDKKKAEKARCLDLDTFPPISEKYVTCDEADRSASPGAKVESAPSQRASTSAAPTPKPMATPSPRTASAPLETALKEELSAIATRFMTARADGDSATIELITTPQFLFRDVEPDNLHQPRSKDIARTVFLSEIRKGAFTYTECSLEAATIKPDGLNATLIYRCNLNETSSKGTSTIRGLALYIFEKVNNGWKIKQANSNKPMN